MQTRPISVADWDQDEDFPIFPEGSQPKSLLRCPDNLISADLIAGHKYLLKTPRTWQIMQIWSEIIAYEISLLCGVNVPRCFLAIDADNRPGVLVEFFYNYPRMTFTERFVHGSDLLRVTTIDKKRGRPHGARSNVIVCRKYGIADAVRLWGIILTFDALIGNSDRHPDNWGILWRYYHGMLPVVQLAPAFDNGTSLGYERPEDAISTSWPSAKLFNYVAKGVHHCGWSHGDDARAGHISLCARFAQAFPEASEAMKNVVRFPPTELDRIMEACTRMGGPLPFTVSRGRFVSDLLNIRRSLLIKALGD